MGAQAPAQLSQVKKSKSGQIPRAEIRRNGDVKEYRRNRWSGLAPRSAHLFSRETSPTAKKHFREPFCSVRSQFAIERRLGNGMPLSSYSIDKRPLRLYTSIQYPILGIDMYLFGALQSAALAVTLLSAQKLQPLSSRPCVVLGVKAGICTKLAVPENRATGTGRRIRLNILFFPSYSKVPGVDAVTSMSGGPGEGTASQVALFFTRDQIEKLRKKYSVLYVDSRGTGRSDPIDCPIKIRSHETYFDTGMLDLKVLNQCWTKLSERADLRWYNTNAAVDDLNDVRKALGVRKLILVGYSGGTRDSEVYARRHPSSVRAMLLFGVNSPRFKLPLPFARARQYGLDGLFRQCSIDKACARAFPHIKDEFTQVAATIRSKNVTATIDGPAGPERLTLGYAIFAERIGLMLYARNTAAAIPYLIHQAYEGDWRPFLYAVVRMMKSAEFFEAAPLGVSRGYYLSATCSEDTPFITQSEIRRETAGTFAGDTRIQLQKAACARWPVPTVDPGFLEPVHSTVPTLMVSDRYDAATPWWIGTPIFPDLRMVGR